MGAIIYLALSYWAAGQTIYKNYILIGSMSNIIMKKLMVGAILGWALIPIAIIKLIIHLFSNRY